MSSLFITSSGTEIGKTYLTGALLAYDRQKQQVLSASKLIASGWQEEQVAWARSDTGAILTAQGLPITPEHIEQISPFRFKAPLSPDLAGKLEKKVINPALLIEKSHAIQSVAAKKQQGHLFEGVGGVMCPIAPPFTVLDWMLALGCPAVLVVGTYLGALSHALTALAVLKHHGITITAVVVNESVNSTVSLTQTVESLSECDSRYDYFKLPRVNNAHTQMHFNLEVARLYTRLLEKFNLKKCA